jgi:transposase-like protein
MTKLTAPTIIQWYQFYRDVCSNWLLRNHIQIGGEGVTVELDESVVARRKYNRGRLIKEKWVFDGYAPTSGGVFLELVPDRSASTLLPLVRKYVVPGSTIITDKWKSYCGISKMEVEPRYLHQEVDHSKNFVDPKTGACTNRIEAMWNSCKKKFKTMCGVQQSMLPSYLDEFLWRQQHGKESGSAAMQNILKHIAEWYPTP